MKDRISCLFFGVLMVALLGVGAALAAETAKITVLNPRGIQPPIRLIPNLYRGYAFPTHRAVCEGNL